MDFEFEMSDGWLVESDFVENRWAVILLQIIDPDRPCLLENRTDVGQSTGVLIREGCGKRTPFRAQWICLLANLVSYDTRRVASKS